METRMNLQREEGLRRGSMLIRLLRSDSGQDLIEYGLLVGVITAASILAITHIGTKVVGYFTTVSSALPSR
jgi:Flp pilus assembly pilin Flp